jgi:SpoVK/Ycf46/Vps4 family AAA+-type ATPase
MNVQRIASRFNWETGDRFVVLYGIHTGDSFCTPDLLVCDIEQALHRYLQAQGIQRILFYSGVDKLYFLDRQSRDRCQLRSSANSSDRNDQRPLFKPGPLGKKRGLLKKTNTDGNDGNSQNGNQQASPSPTRLQDANVLPILEHVMQDTSQRSAIVFSHAEDLANFDHRRELFGRIVKWSHLPPSNQNLCIFVFHHEDQTSLREFLDRIGFTFLANLIQNREQWRQQQFNLFRMETPPPAELAALRDRLRLSGEIPVDSIEWEHIHQLNTWLAAENRPLNYWYNQFRSAKELSIKTARERKWLSGNVSTKSAWERLHELIGLQSVKKAVNQLSATLQTQRQRQQEGTQIDPPRLHLVFTGNPGTGKTTVARLIGEIYRDLGLLQRGHVVEVAGRDLVAGYVGQTAIRTNETIDRALDGVLFVDEAYTLAQGGENDFGQEAIEALLKRMEDDCDRLAVVVAGYPQPMQEFIESNPGLQRRFPKNIVFEDYQPKELMAILQQQVRGVNATMTDELQTELHQVLTQLYQNRDENFGNAGLVENLFREMDELRSARVWENGLDPLQEPYQVADLPAKYRSESDRDPENLENLLQELDSLVGLTEVKEKIYEIINSERGDQYLREMGKEQAVGTTSRHMVFLGNPGTGKTTVARLIGRIFRCLGLLAKGDFHEVSRRDLVGQYVGHTAEKTTQVVESALDGVLFVDEAYALARGGYPADFGREAIDTLVPMMENYRDRLIVIFAGYSREMQEFINANSGIESRIGYEITFPDYQPSQLHAIFLYLCQQYGRICPESVSQEVATRLQTMYEQRSRTFGNGREVRKFYEHMVQRQKNRLVRYNLTGEDMLTFSCEDIPPSQP